MLSAVLTLCFAVTATPAPDPPASEVGRRGDAPPPAAALPGDRLPLAAPASAAPPPPATTSAPAAVPAATTSAPASATVVSLDPRVELVRGALPFAIAIEGEDTGTGDDLDRAAGFVAVTPRAPLILVVHDVAVDEQLAIDLVRVGKLGKGRAKATVVVTSGAKKPRALLALAPTVATRIVTSSFGAPFGNGAGMLPPAKAAKGGGAKGDAIAAKAYAAAPVRQLAPVPAGTTLLEIRVDAPLALRLVIDKRVAGDSLALVPLSGAPALAPLAPLVPPVVVPVPVPLPALGAVAPPLVPAIVAPPVVAPPPPVVAPVVVESAPVVERAAPVVVDDRHASDATTNDAAAQVDDTSTNPWPRLLAEVHAGGSAVLGGLQAFVPAGGARILLGPRNLDAALGVAVDFDGQSAPFIDIPSSTGGADVSGSWSMSSTRLRMEGHLGIGDLALFESRLGVTVGAGARFAWHTATMPGVRKQLFVVGATARVAPEASFPAGPGRFAVALPLDGTLDLSPDVQGFAPVAAGVFLGYRLDL